MSKTVHNNGAYFTNGKVALIDGVSIIRIHSYARPAPKHFPRRLWYWLADKFTVQVTGEEL